MVRTREDINPLKRNIFNNQMFATAKEIANACIQRGRYSIKIKLVNPQSKRVRVKDKQGNVLREITVRRRTIYPPKCKRKRY